MTLPPAFSLYPFTVPLPPPSLDRLVPLIEAMRSTLVPLGDGEELLISGTKFLLRERLDWWGISLGHTNKLLTRVTWIRLGRNLPTHRPPLFPLTSSLPLPSLSRSYFAIF